MTEKPSDFDRKLSEMDGLPDSVRTQPSTIRVIPPMGIGGAQMFIVQTFRQREIGDTIFLECADASGMTRIALPPTVADAIARQRDALTDKNRSRAARANAQARAERGELPGFMRGKRQTRKGNA